MEKDKVIIERLLTESSLSRIQHWIETKEIATISACRSRLINVTPKTDMGGFEEGHVFTVSENAKRTNQLSAALVSLGYGVTRIGGNYIENFGTEKATEVSEKSFFVVNLNDDPEFYNNIFKLSELFNQDSFLYKEKFSDNAVLVYTNYLKQEDNRGVVRVRYGEEDNVGKIHYGISNDGLSRIKNKAFAFMTDEVYAKAALDTDEYSFNSRKAARKRRRMDKEMNETVHLCMVEDEPMDHDNHGKWALFECARPALRGIGRVR